MIHFDIGPRDDPQPLIDGQDTIVPRVGTRSDRAENMVKGRIGSKVPLHTVLLLACVSSRNQAFDDTSNLVDWILHLVVCV